MSTADRPDDAQALEHLRTLLRIPTMSHPDAALDDHAAFTRYAETLRELYPALHGALERELVAGRTLLYRWPGAEPGPATVLMAHYDVVPATAEGWTHPPFDAVVTGRGADRVLWGRGTLDNKGSGVAILEGVERSIRAGVTPRRDVYLLFGHDEETNSTGAIAAAALLRERGVELAFVLDEGGAVVERLFPTVERPVAVVGVSEKGTTNFILTVEQAGGHASTPPKVTATTRLARAIDRVSRRPFPARLNDVTARMVRTVGPHGRGALRVVFTHPRVFRPLLTAVFARLNVDTAAIVRTTVAVTQLEGSLAPNALPERARAVLNVRIAIGSSVEATRRHLERAIGDPLVRVDTELENEPAPVSAMEGPRWHQLERAITAVYPEAVVTPYVQTGATDSRQFAAHCRHVYRFSPFEMSNDERAGLHAKNERMRVATFFTGIRFFEGLLRTL